MKTPLVIAWSLPIFLAAIAATGAEKKKEVSPLIVAALNALPLDQRNGYQAARSRIANDDGLAVKTWFANAQRLNPTVRIVLELDYSDALIESVEKLVDARKKPLAVRRGQKRPAVDLNICKRRVKDAEGVLLLLKGRVQNLTLLWPEIETRITKIEALKKQLGE